MKSLFLGLCLMIGTDAFAARIGRSTKYLDSRKGPNNNCVKIAPKFNSDKEVYRRVCINDPEKDSLYGDRKYLRELDLNRICIWEDKGNLKVQFKTRSSKKKGNSKRKYDLYLLSPRLRGFSGRSSHYDLTLDRKDNWTSYYMFRATSENRGPKKIKNVALRSFNGVYPGDDVWREMSRSGNIKTKKWLGSEYVTFQVKRKYICPRYTDCRFKVAGFTSEESGKYEVDRIPATEICLRAEEALR